MMRNSEGEIRKATVAVVLLILVASQIGTRSMTLATEPTVARLAA